MSPHRFQFERGEAAFETWGLKFGRLWRVVVQVAKPRRPEPSPYSFAPSGCEGCGRAGVEGLCVECQRRIAAAQQQFWSNW